MPPAVYKRQLLLTARNINAALAEVCVVAVGEAHYKVVSLSCLTGVYYLLLGEVRQQYISEVNAMTSY